MKEIKLFNKLPQTKADIAKDFNLIRDKVLEGEINPLDFISQVSALEKLFADLKKDMLIKDAVLEEAEKYGTKSFEKGSAKFTIAEVGTRYDYSVCDDQVWNDLDGQIKLLTERRKARESFLHGVTGSVSIYDKNGVQLLPPAKTSTTQVKVTLK